MRYNDAHNSAHDARRDILLRVLPRYPACWRLAQDVMAFSAMNVVRHSIAQPRAPHCSGRIYFMVLSCRLQKAFTEKLVFSLSSP